MAIGRLELLQSRISDNMKKSISKERIIALDEDQLTQLPVKLVSQARAIALKVVDELNKLYERD